ncbi:hypothetical protein LTR16_004677 [Cryomyces antarcticus]|uniref:BZIP domain-containing protein n=1 Tax=Cryomyces antarcticus TaxID=329879 RepID=A0ABR0LPF2_9PEZI|nr:hypothetical protein LTR60_004156 [Cryomyces antarcticus]KAK5200850.1 hypothetical protein LTR16_004677 [Cryomyces antarcticus]
MTTEQLRTVEDRGLPASGHGFYDKPRQAEVMKHGFTAVNSLSSPPVPFLSEEGVRQHYLPFRETSQIQSPNTGPMRSPSAVLKAVETGHVSKDRREEPTNGSPRRRRQKSDIESGAMPDTHQPNSTPTHPKKRRRETPNSGDGDGSAGGTGQPLQRQQHSGADDPNQSSTMQLDRHHREASPSEQEWDGHQHADGEEDAALRGALTKEVRSAESQRHDHQHLEGNDEARRRDAISIESESSESRQSDNRVATPEGDPSRKKQQDQEKDRVLIARVEAEKGRRKRQSYENRLRYLQKA